MAEAEGGGRKILRGLVIAIVIVAVLVLGAVFWHQVGAALSWIGRFVSDHVPGQTNQKVAVVIYLLISILLGIVFSKAGHFTAYGIVMGLGPLLWFLFWEGFPVLGLKPTWTGSMGLSHLGPTEVITWAVVADVVVTLVFVPLELREKMRSRSHRLGDAED